MENHNFENHFSTVSMKKYCINKCFKIFLVLYQWKKWGNTGFRIFVIRKSENRFFPTFPILYINPFMTNFYSKLSREKSIFIILHFIASIKIIVSLNSSKIVLVLYQWKIRAKMRKQTLSYKRDWFSHFCPNL